MAEHRAKHRLHKTMYYLFFIFFILILHPVVQAQTPILEYKFNETGTAAPSTGSDSTALTLRNYAGTAEDFHDDPMGVSGLPGDRAFKNQITEPGSYMGGTGGKADQADLDAIDTLWSFTLCGWFKTTSTTPIKYSTLFENGTNTGFKLETSGDGVFKLKVDGNSASTTASYTDTEAWVFFAVTYDGTNSTNNVKFYKGTKIASVTQVATGTINKGQVDANNLGLSIGNESVSSPDEAFDGYLDNMRIYGSQADSSGVLTQTQLEDIRRVDADMGKYLLAEVRVNASSDDAEQIVSTGAMDLTSSDLELVVESGTQTVGMRFQNIQIPQGSTIVYSYVQFTVDELGTESTSLSLYGQTADNPSTFTTANSNISSRAKTSASIEWNNVAGWDNTTGVADPYQQTPNLSSIIQEIVNRSGWSKGNSIVIIVTGTGKRVAVSYDGDSDEAPKLIILYTPPTDNFFLLLE